MAGLAGKTERHLAERTTAVGNATTIVERLGVGRAGHEVA